MKYAYKNGIILDGSENMQPIRNKVILVNGDTIEAIIDKDSFYKGYEEVDLKGQYIMPGLINLHVHLASSGKPDLKPRDNEALVKRLLGNKLAKEVTYHMICHFAKLELLGGVTTIRTVGGLADFDTRCRDEIKDGKRVGPRILAANEAISVPHGHMAGSVAIAAQTVDEALAKLEELKKQKVDLVKIMVTGGVLDAKTKGTPGELKMQGDMIRQICDYAHNLGLKVAAHTESSEGVRIALENGVDSVEHGAIMDEETVQLYKETGAFVCCTISPAVPYAWFDPKESGVSEKDNYNGQVVINGIVEGAKTALDNGIPVGLGNDTSCAYVTQYDYWRELVLFKEHCDVTNRFALYTATLRNAQLVGLGDITGSIEVGKKADMIVTKGNPLVNLRTLKHIEMVSANGKLIKNPKFRRNKVVDKAMDPFC